MYSSLHRHDLRILASETALETDRRTNNNEIRCGLPLDFFVFSQDVQVLASDLDWLIDGETLETVTEVHSCLCGIALIGGRLGDYGRSWVAKTVSSFDPADLQFEPLKLCAFVTTSSGLGSVKSNGLACGLLKLTAVAKLCATLDSVSPVNESRATMVRANGDGFARTAVEGSRPAGELVDSARASTDSR